MEKIDFKILTNYILSFNSLDYLNADLIEEWIFELINLGYKSDAIYMLASFSKPIDLAEIKPYLKRVFNEFNLKEKTGFEAKKSFIKYHLNQIANSENIRGNLRKVIDLYYDFESDLDITDFYLLYYAWEELEEIKVNFYYPNVDLGNIEKVVIEKALIWINEK